MRLERAQGCLLVGAHEGLHPATSAARIAANRRSARCWAALVSVRPAMWTLSLEYGRGPRSQRQPRLAPSGAKRLAVQPLPPRAHRPVISTAASLRKRRQPIDAANFAELFRRAQRALGIRLRKFYSTKHTYVSMALTRNVNIRWLSEQTAVAVTTLLKHYGRFSTRSTRIRRAFEDRGGQGPD
jgi:hypothetical protein